MRSILFQQPNGCFLFHFACMTWSCKLLLFFSREPTSFAWCPPSMNAPDSSSSCYFFPFPRALQLVPSLTMHAFITIPMTCSVSSSTTSPFPHTTTTPLYAICPTQRASLTAAVYSIPKHAWHVSFVHEPFLSHAT